jgi:hypothetical protein
MKPQTDSDRRPAKLVAGTVLVLVTLLISVVFIKHFDGHADRSAAAASGSDLTHSRAEKAPAAAPASTAAAAAPTSAAPASAAQEPPNPFKAFAARGRGGPPVAASATPSAPPSAAAEPVDPFKAFLESGQASAATAPPATAPTGQDSPNAPPAGEDPFKEALERQQQKQQQP